MISSLKNFFCCCRDSETAPRASDTEAQTIDQEDVTSSEISSLASSSDSSYMPREAVRALAIPNIVRRRRAHGLPPIPNPLLRQPSDLDDSIEFPVFNIGSNNPSMGSISILGNVGSRSTSPS